MIDIRFLPHNTHLENPDLFRERDPQLRMLKDQTYVFQSSLLDKIPTDIVGIYTLGGGRQIGKTTLLKQLMARLLDQNVDPNSIAFFTGELIDDSHALLYLLQRQLEAMPKNAMRYLFLDEVTYIRDWDKTIKYIADAGLLEQTELILTGSELTVIQEARMRFPGRRGKAKAVDFHLYPLSFREVVEMKKIIQEPLDEVLSHPSPAIVDTLSNEFKNYLKHGGFLTAINDIAVDGRISVSTLHTYSDWIRGDVLKRGKQEHFLREILSAVIKRYNSQLTWNALAHDLSIDHPATVSDYVMLLEMMDVLFVQSALLEDKLAAAPKKARKIVFTDPFIFHAIRSWLWPVEDPYSSQINTIIDDPELSSKIVEACVSTHYRRVYST